MEEELIVPELAMSAPESANAGAADAGKRHDVTTITDLIELYRKLPDERGEVMLTELFNGIRLAGAHLNLLVAVGAVVDPSKPQTVTWIDDDKGETEVNTHTADGEPFISLKAYRDAPTT